MITEKNYLKGAALGTLGFCTSWAVDKHGTGPEWVEVVEVDLQLPNLASPLQGLRIVHVSDLHYSRTVSGKYLHRCVDRINLLAPDIVIITGDYITHDIRGQFRQKVVNLLAKIKSRLGVYACFGNHDYGVTASLGSWQHDLLSDLSEGMNSVGVNLLRNQSVTLDIDGKPLSLIGLGDLWVGDMDPEKAFAKVHAEHPAIALLHNPDGTEHLKAFSVDAVMSGHTHGVRKRLTKSPNWKIKTRRFSAGLYDIDGTKLYVNRGLGRLGKLLFNPRPEITVFTLC